MKLAERILLTSEAERLLQDGGSLDEILTSLRERGYSKLESTAVLMPLLGMRDAKQFVHESPVWSDVKQRDDRLFDDLNLSNEGAD